MDFSSLSHKYYETTSLRNDEVLRLQESWQKYLQLPQTPTESTLTYVIGERGNGKTKLLAQTLESIRKSSDKRKHVVVSLTSDLNNNHHKLSKALYYSLDSDIVLSPNIVKKLPDIEFLDFTSGTLNSIKASSFLETVMTGRYTENRQSVNKETAVSYFFNSLMPALIRDGAVEKFFFVVDDRDTNLTDKSIFNSTYLALVQHLQEAKGAWTLLAMRPRTLSKIIKLAKKPPYSQRINLNVFTEEQIGRVMFNMCGKGISALPIKPSDLKSNLHLMLLMNQVNK